MNSTRLKEVFMLKRIMVAYDDGKQATQALQAAIELAKATNAEIDLISIYSLPNFQILEDAYPDITTIATQFEESSRQHLEAIQAQAADKISQENIAVRQYIWEGKPGPIITEYAEGLKVDLIVIGSNNKNGIERLFAGSVSTYVLQHVSCPVLVIKELNKTGILQKILVAYDDSTQATKALDTAIEMAKWVEAEIHLVSAYTLPINDWEAPYLGASENIRATFFESALEYVNKIQTEALYKVREANISVYAYVVEGKPGPCIVDLAEEIKVDLIVMGAHNRGTVARVFLGSVSNYVFQQAGCQVLVVK